MQTLTTTRELDTELSRIDLQNAIYKLSTLADKFKKEYPKICQIAADLSSEISDKFQLMCAEIETAIDCEYEDLSPEQEDALDELAEKAENLHK